MRKLGTRRGGSGEGPRAIHDEGSGGKPCRDSTSRHTRGHPQSHRVLILGGDTALTELLGIVVARFAVPNVIGASRPFAQELASRSAWLAFVIDEHFEGGGLNALERLRAAGFTVPALLLADAED